jgi:hypothetical protein
MQENCEFKWNQQQFYGKQYFHDTHSRVAMVAAEVGTGRIVIPSKQTMLAEVHRAKGHNTFETFLKPVSVDYVLPVLSWHPHIGLGSLINEMISLVKFQQFNRSIGATD